MHNLGPADDVELRLSTNGGGSYSTALGQSTSDGSQVVTVRSSWFTTAAKVRVTWLNNAGITDTSDNNFQIGNSSTPNQAPSVSLSAPSNGATFPAPANITVSAAASDSDGSVARVDFFQGSTMIGSDTTSPYTLTWSSVPAGSYTLTAVATDNNGATTTSAARSIIVAVGQTSRSVVFGPSTDHASLVNSYRLEVFGATADIAIATPIAAQNLGKPGVIDGECTADVTTTIQNLAPGNYLVVIAAVGTGGQSRSAPIPFTR
jgi:chitinase